MYAKNSPFGAYCSNNFLASNTIYVSTEHNNPKIFQKYFKLLDFIFKEIKLCELGIKDINKLLKTEVCQTGFKRLN